ncbi:hypothetical protein [Oculatella sp. LEGE 06141]|uniref:hypothetical protein n=1 Tax=Oculatella sp. LEGE 06141 TaxID=1828648 RepID=UPI0030D7CEF7
MQVSVYPGWIVGVSGTRTDGYSCWVVGSDCVALNDGRRYETSHDAMLVGRAFVERHL